MKYFHYTLMPIALACLFYSACSDVGVSGYVIDLNNGVPVNGALVKVTDKSAGDKTYNTVTVNGVFNIDIEQSASRTHELEFNIFKIGCFPVDETSSADDSLVFFMLCP